MATAGRKPKPTSLKLVTGNPGGRPLNMNEPKPEIVAPTPPRFLRGEALAEWNRLMPALLKLKLMSELDRAAFAAYCQCFARLCEAEEQIAKASALGFTQNGYPIINPWVTIAQQAMNQMRAFMAEFGLTPAARVRLHVQPEAEQDDGQAFKF